MKTKNKILIICPFVKPNLGGVESHIEKLANYIINQGLFPVIITYQPLTRKTKGESHETHIDHEIIRQSWFGNGWFNILEKYFPLQFLYLFPGLFFCSLNYYRKHHQEIICIHAHGLVSAVITRCLNVFYPTRTVVSTHAIYQFSQRKILAILVKKILQPFDKILAVSQVSLDELVNLGIPRKKLSVHPNWIDANIFKPEPIKRKGIHFLFIGRLIDKKGIKLFIETAIKIPTVTFNIIGDGPEVDYVKTNASNYKNIKYYGPLLAFNSSDLKKIVFLYNQADYLVSPYLYDEGFSTVLLESLACGTPTIITNRGSPPTFISPKVSHLLPSNPTSSDLIKLIKQIISNKTKIISRSECVRFANKNFNQHNADIIIKSYYSS